MARISFQQHKYKITRRLPCSRCGAAVPRSRTMSIYCNPFTNPPWMTWGQGFEHIRTEAEAWRAGDGEVETCAKCRKGAE